MFNLPASMGLTDILSLAIAAILVNNYILVQFLGCCSFFGVSKKTDTALGMGMAVIFVMAIASAASWAVQYFILEEGYAVAVLCARYLPAADHHQLCGARCC